MLLRAEEHTNRPTATPAALSKLSNIDPGHQPLLSQLIDKRCPNSPTEPVTPCDGPLYVAVIDELRFFTAHSDRKKRQTFNDLAIDVAARGRAAGIILAAATQKPSTDVVPSSLRDLLAYRWAMRCTTKDASDTILGAGWATAGFSAASIDTRTPGVGLLLAEGHTPARVRSAYLSDDQIRLIAARGRALRDQHTYPAVTVTRATPLRAGSRQASTATQGPHIPPAQGR